MDDELNNEEYLEAELDAKIGQIVRNALSDISATISANLKRRMLDPTITTRRAVAGGPPYTDCHNDEGSGYIFQGYEPSDQEPELNYFIETNQQPMGTIIAAFRDKDTRDFVLDSLNNKK